MVGLPITFSAGISADYGETKYEWDFGDGQTAITTNGNISHAYSTQTWFNVKVKRSNPEYLGVQQSTLQVTIAGPITAATICANGIISYDVCDIQPNGTSTCSGGGVESLIDGETLMGYPGGITTLPTFFVQANNAVGDYQWEYKKYGDPGWSSFGANSSSAQGPPGYGNGVPGTWEVRCVLTDSCGNTFISDSYYVSAYASTECSN
jgi:hypothetical protein